MGADADVLATLMPWHLIFRCLQLCDMPQVRRKLLWVLAAPCWLMLLDILKTMWVHHAHAFPTQNVTP